MLREGDLWKLVDSDEPADKSLGASSCLFS